MSDDITRRTFIGTAAGIVLAPVADAASEQTAATRRTLRAAVDRIIPARGKMPAASSVGAVEYLEALSARDQDIQQRLSKAIAALGPTFAAGAENEQVSALENLEKADPPSFAALRDVLYEAYYVVGKYLMNHPYVEGVFDEPFEATTHASNPLFSQQFYETDRGRGFVRGYSLVVYRPYGPASVAWGDSEPVPWGARHHHEMRLRFRHSVGIAVMAEDLPEEINRVGLDDTAKDSNGIPAPRVTYRASDNTKAMLQHGAHAARQVLEAAGARTILDSGRVMNFAHYMGTARMGTDPKRSVVDQWHRAHEVPNLFIVDGSSFTTSAAVNPTSTIGALALRCADGIWERRGEWT